MTLVSLVSMTTSEESPIHCSMFIHSMILEIRLFVLENIAPEILLSKPIDYIVPSSNLFSIMISYKFRSDF